MSFRDIDIEMLDGLRRNTEQWSQFVYGDFGVTEPYIVVAGNHRQYRQWQRETENMNSVYAREMQDVQGYTLYPGQIVLEGTAWENPLFDWATDMIRRHEAMFAEFVRDMLLVGARWETGMHEDTGKASRHNGK